MTTTSLLYLKVKKGKNGYFWRLLQYYCKSTSTITISMWPIAIHIIFAIVKISPIFKDQCAHFSLNYHFYSFLLLLITFSPWLCYWYCWEKTDVVHSWDLKGENLFLLNTNVMFAVLLFCFQAVLSWLQRNVTCLMIDQF